MSARVKLMAGLRPSRAEAETLLLLYAVGPGGCDVEELTGRLGLVDQQRAAVAWAVDRVGAQGLLSDEAGRIGVTELGLLRLRDAFVGLRWGG